MSQEVSHHLALAPEVDGKGDGVKAHLEIGGVGHRVIGGLGDWGIGRLWDWGIGRSDQEGDWEVGGSGNQEIRQGRKS